MKLSIRARHNKQATYKASADRVASLSERGVAETPETEWMPVELKDEAEANALRLVQTAKGQGEERSTVKGQGRRDQLSRVRAEETNHQGSGWERSTIKGQGERDQLSRVRVRRDQLLRVRAGETNY